MPGPLDGPELAAEVGRRRPGAKVLYATGYADRGGPRRTAQGIPAPVLQKPYSMEALAREVRRVLDGAG